MNKFYIKLTEEALCDLRSDCLIRAHNCEEAAYGISDDDRKKLLLNKSSKWRDFAEQLGRSHWESVKKKG